MYQWMRLDELVEGYLRTGRDEMQEVAVKKLGMRGGRSKPRSAR
jgi:hypothetical protein